MNESFRRTGALLALALSIVALLAGCRGAVNPIATPLAATATPTGPLVTPTPAIAPTPTISAAMTALLSPGPTMSNIGQFFFLNSGDLWQVQSDGRIVHVTRGLSLGPWAMVPDGTRAIVVVRADSDGNTTESLRVVRGDGILSVPLYGPAPTSGASAASAIVALDWSWDQTKLAVAFADGSIAVLPVPEDEGQYPVAVERIVPAGSTPASSNLEWSPGGNGIAFVTHSGGQDRLAVVALGEDPHEVVGDVSVRTFAWLPGRGRLAFVLQAPGGGTSGSVFTVAADGTSRELLLSAGQFAPAATVMALHPSPDGRSLAVIVFAPGRGGEPVFQSLWTLTIDGAELTRIPVATGFRVTEVWWTSQGLTWRAVSLSAPFGSDPTAYAGEGVFVLQRYDEATRSSTSIFSAASAR